MEFVLRLLGMQFTVYLGPETVEESDDSFRLGTTDHSFGFAPDPVFPDLIWEDE